MSLTETINISLWACNISHPIRHMDDWLAGVEQTVVEAAGMGADILMLPEYACAHWLAFAPQDIRPDEEIPWLAQEARHVLPHFAALAARHDIAILAGSGPVADGQGGYFNQARLYFPDRPQPVLQNKLCLTPNERNPQAWNLVPGDRLEVIRWRGMTMVIVTCLDIELPALSSYLSRNVPGLDLVLTPSMTSKPSGYTRVNGCAKARAVELAAAVAAVGCVGGVAGRPDDSNHGGCAVYLPCEEALGYDGLHAVIPGSSAVEGPGPMLHARDIPIGQVRRIREQGLEVWPGAWTADHLELTDSNNSDGDA